MYSTSKKQRVCGTHATELGELVRACLYDGDERIAQLTERFQIDMKITDIDILLSVARDFAATYKLLPETLKGLVADTK